MVIRDVGLDVETRRERRVVHDQPIRIVGFEPLECLLQPSAVIGVVHQVNAPILVDYGPANDRRVVAVAIDDTLEGRQLALPRTLGQQTPIGQLGPDQQPQTIGNIIVARVGYLDVTAQAVETKLFRFADSSSRNAVDGVVQIVSG